MKEKAVKHKAAAWPKLTRCLIAILRGITPKDAVDAAKVLVDEGLEVIEIPLNSPSAFESIEKIARFAPDNIVVGAGTVLQVDDVDRVVDAGGKILLAPNFDRDVLGRANEHGMITMPGVFTASEALGALHCGASGLKIFPASILGPQGMNAIGAVLPDDVVMAAVGGVGEADFEDYRNAGINTFGLGSSLYKPGRSIGEIQTAARAVVKSYDRVFGS